ncbi:Lytic transglycosylase catalytic [Methylocella silvestris BL2]|uniref:Lytic transglycosylase catalytic n=2 Tax=Methylocella silvestris TaxID=199596 RepID=B8EL28_METSB|nr:Lytic transglycosylase catalytic [Methylocella silvestris BL2]
MLVAAAISIFDFARLETSARAESGDAKLCEREMTRAAGKYNIPLGVLYAVGLTESGRRGSLSPFALNIQGASFFPSSRDEAMRRFDGARRDGAQLIDIGCMQINHHFHGRQFQSVSAIFDPRQNVDYAAQFLKRLRESEGSWTLAAARYHAGPDNNPAQKKYVCQVIENMVASGFGAWTAGARAFCR